MDTFLSDDERSILERICGEVGVPCSVVEKMLVAEHRVYGMGRRHGIWEALEPLVSEGVNGQVETEVNQ